MNSGLARCAIFIKVTNQNLIFLGCYIKENQ